MKFLFLLLTLLVLNGIFLDTSAQPAGAETSFDKTVGKSLYIDVHHFKPGEVKYEAVAQAHAKDVALQEKYGVKFIKFWVDENKGLVYCLSSSSDSESIRKTHAEAHGLIPTNIYRVTEGSEAPSTGPNDYFIDVHELGAGKVLAKDVAEAHKKDLVAEQKHGVNFINYWVDEAQGVVMCLSQSKDTASIIKTHQEAHGLIPVAVMKVRQGE